MLFNSFEFFLFFPIVTILYFLLPHKLRWIHLLAASCYFYMAFVPVYILIIFFTIVIDYVAGIMIEQAEGRRRKLFLIMSLVANIGVLAIFKYYNFIAVNINDLIGLTNTGLKMPLLGILLPIGLSFHTFQAMSYTIEVFRGNQKAERHFGIYSLYVMFYPQLVAGPIERPQNIIHQLHEEHRFDYDDAVWGSRMILWGMLKKTVIADRLAIITDPIFNHPHAYSGTALCIGTILFAFQIFCDFSGYSDIALGTARIMGIRLMTNFNHPYNAESITEFWKKWHISLSTWLRDYLFNPIAMGLREKGIYSIVIAALVTFLISGLWHGAAWTYVIWGALHGIAITYELLTRKSRKKLFQKIPVRIGRLISRLLTFSYVCFAYIFFRANTIKDAVYIVKKITHLPSELLQILHTHKLYFLNLPGLFLLRDALMAIVVLESAHFICRKYHLIDQFKHQPALFRWSLYVAGLACFFFMGVFEKHSFIYFQF